jgi:hypothetical protein
MAATPAEATRPEKARICNGQALIRPRVPGAVSTRMIKANVDCCRGRPTCTARGTLHNPLVVPPEPRKETP